MHMESIAVKNLYKKYKISQRTATGRLYRNGEILIPSPI